MQEIRGAKKFRQNGIESSLKIKFDIMFSNIVATGEFAWAPSSGVLGGNDVNPSINKSNINGVDFKEGNSDSEEDAIPNLDTNISRMDGGGAYVKQQQHKEQWQKKRTRSF
jgi:hypothetical protein